MAKKKVKEIEAEIEMQLDEESSMIDLVGVIKSEMDDAKDFIHQVGEERSESTEYYLVGEPEATSTLQSEFISTDVRDTVLFMLPNIMRTFFGTKKVVEFVPNGPEDIPLAEQQTDYINYIVQQRIRVSMLCTLHSKMRWCVRRVLLRALGRFNYSFNTRIHRFRSTIVSSLGTRSEC